MQNTDNHGTANLIPDNTGKPALQTGTATVGDRWNLTDKLGSAIAQTTNGAGPSSGTAVIGELSDYSDYGVQEYGTTGWDADPNYTGQPTNATHTTHRFHARTQDPQTGTWTSQDTWRGLLSEPQTLNRYNYVTNNPTTLTDHMGYYAMIDDGGLNSGGFGIRAIDLLRPTPPTPPFYLQRPAPPTPVYSGTPWAPRYQTPSYFNQAVQRASTHPYTPTRASQPQISSTHTALKCAGVKVGMSPEQLAINEACGNALAVANLQTKPQWVQDLTHANQAFADKARPLVLLVTAGLSGPGATKAETGSAARGMLAGSGPVSGVLEASIRVKSLAALRNYYPKGGGVEYVFDPRTGTFATGVVNPSAGLTGSPHVQLAQSIGANPATVVGGTLTRGADGAFNTTEQSGHFWQNWSPEIRQQFVDTMRGYGIDVRH